MTARPSPSQATTADRHFAHNTMPEPDNRNFGIAISRAFDVLRCYSPSQPHLGVSEIARMTGLPKATVSRLTYTLESLGYLYRLMPTGKYRLGWGVLSLGYPLLASMPLRQIARPAMHALAVKLRCNVNLGTIDRLSVVYVETARFDETSVARPDIGATHPLLKSSIGLAILANMDPRRRQPIENRLRIADQAAWQTAMPRVESCRKDLTRLGYCATESAVHPGYLTIAAPMRVPAYEEPLAFNCAMPASQVRKGEVEREIGPRLVAMAKSVELGLGYS